MEEFLGTGRRKRAVASVRLRKGTGTITINDKNFDDVPLSIQEKKVILEPFVICNLEKQYDCLIRSSGGGYKAQLESIRLGISRALVSENENRREVLKEKDFLTRDPRKKERKKYGKKKARKSPQFSKR